MVGPSPYSERREVLYAGHVQGVGFRYTVQRLARGYSVTGFVRNLSDGRVELVVEGESGEVDGFLEERYILRIAFSTQDAEISCS